MDLSEQPPGQTLLQGAPHRDEVEEVCGVVLVRIIIVIIIIIVILTVMILLLYYLHDVEEGVPSLDPVQEPHHPRHAL